jgi:hypothetical protein
MDEAMIDQRDAVQENVMIEKKRETSPDESDGALDPAIAVYETRPIAEIQEELRANGIDPAATIAAVKALIKNALRRRGDRGSHHLETLLAAFLPADISWMLVPVARQP